MSSVSDSTAMYLIKSSCIGLIRGALVTTALFPLDVVKFRQQCAENPEKIRQTVFKIMKQEGYQAFYQGLSAQLMSTCLKQIWVWPMITGIPICLERHRVQDIRKEIYTGLAIATTEAVVSTPLERGKIISASTGKSEFSLIGLYKNGWRGALTNWTRLSVLWGTFLPAQKFFRDRALDRLPPGEKLSPAQIAIIGTKVAMVVTLVAAPIDMANTLKMAKNIKIFHLISKKTLVQSYRIWPIDFTSKVVQNTASAMVFDILDRNRL